MLALYLGFSILNIPELNWNPNDSPSGLWFNVRYGILALPAVAILLGILAARQRAFSLLITLVVIFQMFFLR